MQKLTDYTLCYSIAQFTPQDVLTFLIFEKNKRENFSFVHLLSSSCISQKLYGVHGNNCFATEDLPLLVWGNV